MGKLYALGLMMLFLGISDQLPPSQAVAYEAIAVESGGTVAGQVILEGAVPESRVFPAVLYPFNQFCQKNKAISDGKGHFFLHDVLVGRGQGLKDVVVVIEGVAKGKPFEPLVPEITSRGCEFLPFMNVVQNQGSFVMNNEDSVLHNSQVYQAEKGNVILNVPIPPNSVRTHPIHFEKDRRIFKMICGMHEFMQTWGFAVDNPYYAVTDRGGRFTIDQLPPGTYRMIVWHPNFKPIHREITVGANERVSLSFEFDADDVKRSHYESQEKFRVQ